MSKWLKGLAKIWLLTSSLLFGTPHAAVADVTFNTLYSFSSMSNGINHDGAYPTGLFAYKGTLFGTAQSGGTLGQGTIFSLSANGTFTNQHNFTGDDGNMPESPAVRLSNGLFYGTTQAGGKYKAGTVYKIEASGNVVVLHSFQGEDGTNPNATLVEDAEHNLYGTATFGGKFGGGTLFRITRRGVFQTLHHFNGSDGSRPLSLTMHPNGNLYGIALTGGDYNYGTVFKVGAGGDITTLHSFTSLDYSIGGGANDDGAYPFAALQVASDGTLIGAGQNGGVNGTGTLFQIAKDDSFHVLYMFQELDGSGHNLDGWSPRAVVLGKDGSIFGITLYGGANGDGTLFRLGANGVETTLHHFNKATGEGSGGQSLVKATDNTLYGTTNFGGSGGVGTLFSLTGVNLDDTSTTLVVPIIEGRYGQTLRLTATLVSKARGAKVSNQTLHFLLDGIALGDAITDAKGRTQILYRLEEPLLAGSHLLSVTFDGNDANGLNPAKTDSKLIANAAYTLVTLGSVQGSYGQRVTLSATIKRTTDGKKLANQLLTFTVDGVSIGQATTDKNGKATLNYLIDDPLSVGTHTLTADFAGTGFYNGSSGVAKLIVMLSDSQLTLRNGEGSYGQTLFLLANLTKISTGKAIEKQSVLFKVDGAVIGEVKTDSAGRAVLKYKIEENLEVGNHSLTTEFAGTNTINPAVGKAGLIVNPADTALKVTPASGKVGSTITLAGNLRRTTDAQGLSGQTVQFYVDGTLVGSSTTSSGGDVTLSYKIPTSLRAGKHSFWLLFAGDSHYLGSLSPNSTLTVKR